MRKRIIVFFILICMCFSIHEKVRAVDYNTTLKQDILCLMMAYPGYITDVEKDNGGSVYIVMKSGKKILYDDKREKSFEEKFQNTDLQDMMEQPYQLGTVDGAAQKNSDPGRLRVYSLLKEVYGDNKNSVESNLEMANLGYRRFQFNGNNGASISLENAMKELMPISQKRGDISKCLFPSSGTFNYRYISGTGMLSPHSFGIAIDLARDRRDYWKWVPRTEGSLRIKEYPREIVEIFEKNNFVWGGKWSHFDTLHFEYRPEIILKSRYFDDKSQNKKYWYEGAPYKDESVKNYIGKINEKL
ncbi:M15 family metallopeptidase [Clostridium sp. WLY-B-L2]|uniref:M15 family metallopeptidase n=1 Tax=Clostridium aromativorans TaxID=2836848 RepID=A0ABS8N5Q6_9CLOT|nr:M15 family metallopeptidase [Clostridium aromativorans]MCC9295137.1 M15 family metallopeptidase [Clostridium aromativorans]